MSDEALIRFLKLLKDCNYYTLMNEFQSRPGQLHPRDEVVIMKSIMAAHESGTTRQDRAVYAIAKDHFEDATRALERMGS